jgi:uncharacterized protein (DUF1501 family)
MTRLRTTDCEGFYRRDFLRFGAAGLFGLTLPQILKLEAAARDRRGNDTPPTRRAEAVIQLWLGGGPASIDIWDLKPNAPAEIRGQFKPIPTAVSGVQISEHLPLMAQAAKNCTIVRSLAHTIPSHGPATVFMNSGNKPTPALQYPWMGSLSARLLPAEKGVPPYVTFGTRQGGNESGFLGTAYNPFPVESTGNIKGGKGDNGGMRVRGIQLPAGFSLEDLEHRDQLMRDFDSTFRAADASGDLVDGLDAFHKEALEILRSDRTKKAFDLSREPQAVRERYGATPFGQGALAARRMVEAGVRFVTVSLGGWDTHQQNFEALSKRLLPQLDQTLSALINDLSDRGMLDRTVVYCAGEFGRTPKINKTAGRDHWARSMSVVLAGGGFARGGVLGSTDAQGMAPASDACSPDDVSATLFHLLGLNPHQELQTPTGRPVQLFREGNVVEKLLA